MKIAIIGMGNVGIALGHRWAAKGHQVTFGSRHPADHEEQAKAQTIGANVAEVKDAAAGAEVVTLAVPWPAVPAALSAAGDLNGRIVLDCTNPLTPDLSGLAIGCTTSAGEEVAKLARGAKVVKIFNTTGAGNMADPNYGVPVTMLYAGDDAEAKRVAAKLAADVGFDPVDLGPLSASRLLEPLALTWITLALRQKLGTDFVLTIAKRRR
jgi:NADPH-dependent F420 reductase